MGKECDSGAKDRNFGGHIGRRFLLGLLAGYIAYFPALEMILFLNYGRVDKRLFIYGLFLPFQLPLLLNSDFRETIRGDELTLQLFCVASMLLGAILALRMTNVKMTVRDNVNKEIENG